ncbi:MAG: hypothetical protein M0R80_12475 [Proteobacteria bacterium]|jgi:hypothetical protein|nr:hypothetical protein [Pseudomonadota bacterium]
MRSPRIYIDTSVVGGCLDDEFKAPSRALFEKARQGKALLLVSGLLVRELSRAPESVRLVLAGLPSTCVEVIADSAEARALRDAYLKARVVGRASANDAFHVALATVARADLVVSWNFKHVVHYDKIRMFNAVNLMRGYTAIEIRSPLEVV